MADAFSSLHALVTGETKIDVPVPACLNHCINQEVFNCKICGEIFDNIHKYIVHGKSHRSSSCVCGWCGGVWPSYAALCIHQLVWEDKRNKNVSSQGDQSEDSAVGNELTCPLACGIEPMNIGQLKSHLHTFHGARQDQIHCVEKDGETTVNAELPGKTIICPRCSTKFSKDQVGLENHIAFQCLKRSKAVQDRVENIHNQSSTAGEEPLLILLQEIQALILHLKSLLEQTGYKEQFIEEGAVADKKYNKLPSGFTKDILSWVPVGYTLQVLESEEDNFPVMFDVWSQVVDKLSGPDNLQGVCQLLEKELSENLQTGVSPRWSNLPFDPAMLDNPDQEVLVRLEQELGWVK